MADYYVDPSVADGGTGTFGSPYARQDLAITAATGANDTIWLKRGHIYAPSSAEAGVLYILGKSPATSLRIRSRTRK